MAQTGEIPPPIRLSERVVRWPGSHLLIRAEYRSYILQIADQIEGRQGGVVNVEQWSERVRAAAQNQLRHTDRVALLIWRRNNRGLFAALPEQIELTLSAWLDETQGAALRLVIPWDGNATSVHARWAADVIVPAIERITGIERPSTPALSGATPVRADAVRGIRAGEEGD